MCYQCRIILDMSLFRMECSTARADTWRYIRMQSEFEYHWQSKSMPLIWDADRDSSFHTAVTRELRFCTAELFFEKKKEKKNSCRMLNVTF